MRKEHAHDTDAEKIKVSERKIKQRENLNVYFSIAEWCISSFIESRSRTLLDLAVTANFC